MIDFNLGKFNIILGTHRPFELIPMVVILTAEENLGMYVVYFAWLGWNLEISWY